MAKDIDCERTNEPVCPHCGDVFDLGVDDRSLEISYEDGGYTDCQCSGCRKPFVAITTVQYVYSTAIDEGHASDELWGPREQTETV